MLFGLLQIFRELCVSKIQLTLPHRNFFNGVANPKIVYMLLIFFYVYSIDWIFFEKKTVWQKIHENFNGNYTTWEQLFERFLKNESSELLGFLKVDAFLLIWISFALAFYCYILCSGTAKESFTEKYQNL